uniref:Uncharacterized protein n=1 Tax=Heterorhabditis bacteriophora TaxID=37862 RepID=A0A1I7WYU1_HETBA
MNILLLALLIIPTYQWATLEPKYPIQNKLLGDKGLSDIMIPRAFIINPFVSPLAIKWRKMRSRAEEST